MEGDYLPVVSSLAADTAGQIYNVNADTVAAHIAIEIGAAKYFLLTQVDGVLRNLSDPTTLLSYMDMAQLDELVSSGAVGGGMLPKLAACREVLSRGVPRMHIVNGVKPDTLLAEVFTNEGCGTLMVASREPVDAAGKYRRGFRCNWLWQTACSDAVARAGRRGIMIERLRRYVPIRSLSREETALADAIAADLHSRA